MPVKCAVRWDDFRSSPADSDCALEAVRRKIKQSKHDEQNESIVSMRSCKQLPRKTLAGFLEK